MGKDCKILIVDDDQIVRIILSETLLQDGFKNVLMAVNGAEGLDMVREHMPDLVITDMMMPQMNGFQLIQEIQGDIDLRDVRLITMTSRDEMKELITMTGIKDFIVKPFDREQVLQTIKRVLSSARPVEVSKGGLKEESGRSPEKESKNKDSGPPQRSMDENSSKAANISKGWRKETPKKIQSDSLHEKVKKILEEGT